MNKTIKHNNIMSLSNKGEQYIEFICRGCSIGYRNIIWNNFVSSILDEFDREIDNSYLTFEEEPDNIYDPNAIMIVCRGETFGTVGYVGREYTTEIKEILNTCNEYRIDMVDEDERGKKEIRLKLYWN